MYLSYFLSRGITDVIRLNNKVYNASRFTNAGVAHHDLYFVDGSVPTDDILARFLRISEQSSGAIAVHCKGTSAQMSWQLKASVSTWTEIIVGNAAVEFNG